jgi:hypothetical protein
LSVISTRGAHPCFFSSLRQRGAWISSLMLEGRLD